MKDESDRFRLDLDWGLLRSRGLFAAVAIAILIRLAFFIAAEPWDSQALSDHVLVADAAGYHALALRIKESRSFDGFGALRTPIYPLYLAAVYTVTGDRVWFALLLQLLIDVGTVVVVFLLAWTLFRRADIAVLASVLFAVSFVAASMSARVGTDTLFAAVLALSVLWYLRALRERRQWRSFLAVGALIGVATLIRPVGQYLPLFLVVGMMLYPGGLRWKGAGVAAMLVSFVVVITPWQARNQATYGHYALSTTAGYTLANWGAAMTLADAEGITIEEARLRLGGSEMENISNPFEGEAVQRSKAVQYIRDNLGTYTRAHVRGIGYMFGGNAKDEIIYGLRRKDSPITRTVMTNTQPLGSRIMEELKAAPREFFVLPILGVKLLLEYAGLAVGAIVMVRRRDWVVALVLVGIMAYFALVTGVTGDIRFRLPLIPLYLPVSAFGLMIMWEALQRRARRNAAARRRSVAAAEKPA